MAAGVAGAARQFADLAKNLRDIGEEGLRRELFQAIDDAAQSLGDEIQSTANLEDHMPDPYVPALQRDLRVTTHKRTGGSDPGVTDLVQAPTLRRGRGRAVIRLNRGVIGHPVFGMRSRVNARRWAVWKYQEAGMRAGFVDDPAERAVPQVRDKVLEAVHRITEKAVGR